MKNRIKLKDIKDLLLPLFVDEVPDNPGMLQMTRECDKSIVRVQVQGVSRHDFLPESHCVESLDTLRCVIDAPERSLVEVRDVLIGGIIARHSITKHRSPEGIGYSLYMTFMTGNSMYEVCAVGLERGDSSKRRTEVSRAYEDAVGERLGESEVCTSFDPYSRLPKNGCCYCMGEDPCYDALYPEHPLSILRMIVKILVDNNAIKEAT